MKIKYVLGVVILMLLVSTSNLVFKADAQGPAKSDLKVVSADEQSIVVELTSSDFQVETRGVLLGIPTTQGVAVEIVSPNDAPSQLVKLGNVGYMRDQAVAQVQFYPVQHNPVTGETELYQRIVAKVTWQEPRVKVAQPSKVSADYEKFLQTALLNYSTLSRPAVAQGTVASDINATETTTALKIGVTADGLYQLSYTDLTNAGFNLTGIDPRKLQLTNRKTQQAIYVVGEEDGKFDSTDALIFYGQAINTIYTGENIYWLSVGTTNGTRMEARPIDDTAATNPVHFPITLHAEENNAMYSVMPNAAGQDFYFWGERISPSEDITNAIRSAKNYTITLNGLSTTATSATVRVRLMGYTALAHHSKIYLNNTMIDDKSWTGQTVFTHELSIAHSSLVNGANGIRIEAADAKAVVDQFYIDWIEIDYFKTYAVEGNQLTFGVPEACNFQFTLTNLTANAVQLFDVTDPAKVSRFISPTVATGKLQFSDNAKANSRYAVLSPDKIKKPATLKMRSLLDWQTTTNGADYIIITHQDFFTSAKQLADYRQSKDKNLRVVTVNVEDIYDVFNDGIFTPQAIQDFLKYAYSKWTAPAPTYVLLVGDAVKDYRNYLGSGLINYVPTQLIQTVERKPSGDAWLMAPSDNWFAQVSGTDLYPDMFIGRITAQKSEQVDNAIAKIKNYETTPPDSSWNKNVLLIADDNESVFETASNELMAQLPYNYVTKTVYVKSYPTSTGNPTADITKYIENGTFLVNYTGHGATDLWGTWNGKHIFDNNYVLALNNTNKLPIVTVANCLSGDFSVKDTSIAENFLQLKDKGAVAVWAPAALGYPDGHRQMMVKFYQAMFRDGIYKLGEATNIAQMRLYADNMLWADLVETYVLFGDPAMKVGVNAKENSPYVKTTFPANKATSVSLEGDIEIVFNKAMDPSTVKLTSSVAGMVFTPTWSAFTTTVNFAHSNFAQGQTITMTISGQDMLGNALDTKCASLTPAKCTALTWSFTTIAGSGAVVKSGEATTINYTDAKGISTKLEFPAGAVTQDIEFLLTIDEGQWPTYEPSFAKRGFNLVDKNYSLRDDFRFSKPVKVTMQYSNADIGAQALDESSLVLRYFYYNQYAWLDVKSAYKDVCTSNSKYEYKPDENTISVEICNVGQFALFAMTTPQTMIVGGPTMGAIETTYAFTAGVTPISASLPIIYEWTATDYSSPVIHSNGGAKDTALLKWAQPGIKQITVKANSNGSDKFVTATYQINVVKQLVATYLPVIVKAGTVAPTPTVPPTDSTTLVIHGKHTGAVSSLKVSGPNNESLAECAIGHYIGETGLDTDHPNVTDVQCGSFKQVSSYTITAQTAYCGEFKKIYTDTAKVGKVTQVVECAPVTLSIENNATGGIDQIEVKSTAKETLLTCYRNQLPDNTTSLCGKFDPVGTYTIEAFTPGCSKPSQIYPHTDGIAGTSVTQKVSCP